MNDWKTYCGHCRCYRGSFPVKHARLRIHLNTLWSVWTISFIFSSRFVEIERPRNKRSTFGRWCRGSPRHGWPCQNSHCNSRYSTWQSTSPMPAVYCISSSGSFSTGRKINVFTRVCRAYPSSLSRTSIFSLGTFASFRSWWSTYLNVGNK